MESKKNLRPAAFLDRDGVIVRDLGYVYRLEDLEILPQAAETIHELHQLGFLVIVISNQAGVAKGKYAESDVKAFHLALQAELIAKTSVGADAYYYCPHHPDGTVPAYAIACDCRKPGIALLQKAAEDFAIDWSKSFFVGDRRSDIECAEKAKIPGFQILSGQYEVHPHPFANIQGLADVLTYARNMKQRS